MERFGWVQPEEIVRSVLVDGLAQVREAEAAGTLDDLLERMFWSLDVRRRDQVREWITARDVPIVDNFPQDPQQMPCWALLLLGEEEEQVLGEQGSRVEFPDGETGPLPAVFWRGHVGVLSLAEHPVVVKWLYQIAKVFLSGVRTSRVGSAAHVLTWQLSGRDLGFEAAYQQAGRFVYQRLLVVSAQYPQYHHVREPVREGVFSVQQGVGYAR